MKFLFYKPYMPGFFTLVVIFLLLIIFVMIVVAFVTLLERKILGYIDISKGLNSLGFVGTGVQICP